MIYGKNIQIYNSFLKKQVKTLVPICINENIDNYVKTVFYKYNKFDIIEDIITIDNEGTQHFDDGLGYFEIDDVKK